MSKLSCRWKFGFFGQRGTKGDSFWSGNRCSIQFRGFVVVLTQISNLGTSKWRFQKPLQGGLKSIQIPYLKKWSNMKQQQTGEMFSSGPLNFWIDFFTKEKGVGHPNPKLHLDLKQSWANYSDLSQSHPKNVVIVRGNQPKMSNTFKSGNYYARNLQVLGFFDIFWNYINYPRNWPRKKTQGKLTSDMGSENFTHPARTSPWIWTLVLWIPRHLGYQSDSSAGIVLHSHMALGCQCFVSKTRLGSTKTGMGPVRSCCDLFFFSTLHLWN